MQLRERLREELPMMLRKETAGEDARTMQLFIYLDISTL